MRGSKYGEPSSAQDLSAFAMEKKENLAQAEFGRLQKQFKIAMGKRKAYSDNVRHQIHAQNKEIESLTQEHQEVLLTLSQIASPRNAMMEVRERTEFQCLLWTKSKYDSLIRERRAQLGDLDNQILELEKKFERQDQRTEKGKRMNRSKRLQKRVETLEGNLNAVTVHFNGNMTRNYRLQEELRNLHMQKAILDNHYLKLHMKLDQQRKRMQIATERLTEAYEKRAEALTRISDMNARHSKDTIYHNLEMHNQEYALDRETKLKNFAFIKYTDRSELEEQAEKQRALKAAELAQRSQWESFESRKVAHMGLQELAGDRDIDQLLSDFIKREHNNFSCFSYAAELSSEIEAMQRRINDLQSEIIPIMAEKERAESEKLPVLKELEEKLTETTEEANWYEDKCKKSSKVLGQLKSSIETLFQELGCDPTEIMKQLGEKEQITEQNVVQFFGLMEKKTGELLLMETLLRCPAGDGSDQGQPFESPLLSGTRLLRGMDPARPHPPPPALGSADGALDAMEVPLDYDQLRQLILQRHRQEQGDAADLEQQP